MSEKLWYLKQCPLFDRVAPEEAREIERSSKARQFARGEPIYLPADAATSVMLLVSGRAKICHITPEGKQSILAFIEPGELFGELAILEPGDRDEYAETVETSTVVVIPASLIQQLVERYPTVSLGITKLFGLRRRRIERRLKNLLFLSNRDRLIHLLLELAEKYGVPQDDGVGLRIQLSHQDLANVIGSTRETVTVTLRELAQEGLVATGRRRIVLKDISKMAQAVQRANPSIPAGTPTGG